MVRVVSLPLVQLMPSSTLRRTLRKAVGRLWAAATAERRHIAWPEELAVAVAVAVVVVTSPSQCRGCSVCLRRSSLCRLLHVTDRGSTASRERCRWLYEV
jgi:hypothetical protein